MTREEWDQRYRAGEQLFDTPSPLVQSIAGPLDPGIALDLACGAGRNAVFLAGLGWRVTAVDGSAAAIEIVKQRAPQVDAHVADLERDGFAIAPCAWDLVCCAYYFQRDLIPQIQAGVKPGGVAIVIVNLADAEPTPRQASPGELREMFTGWEVLHYCEGVPREACHKRAVAELAARRP
ncbi:MAG: methyltransferase domain-containing protein [Acidobacteriota bacterium]|nr:methyltransferase domain-containing protein [Acidobacteriota bacterium]